ncbi:retrovirus-related Pol polyprotein from transposon TNT 1-94 [Trichonephila clavipes]|nr:retrovirus-related Pol polyprotein from transposon TNT 1-94 [Trichonephila clavipes]
MAAVDFLHHENPANWAGVEPATLGVEGQRETHHSTQIPLTIVRHLKKSDPNFYDLLVLFFQSRSMISMKSRTFFMNSVASTLNRVADMEFNNQISVLTQNNWNTWKHDMQVLLMHYGCWQFIIQTKPEQPDEEATYKDKLDLQLREDVGIFISRVKTAATRLQEAGHKLDDLYIGFQLIRWLPQEFQSTVQQIYRWKEENFRVVKIEAELILEANRLQLMKQDLEKAENAYLSSFTSKKSKTLPGATAAAHGNQMARMITKRKVVSKTDSVKGLPRLNDNGKTHCIPCTLAKSKRVSFKKDGGRKIKTSIGIVAYGPLWSNAN